MVSIHNEYDQPLLDSGHVFHRVEKSHFGRLIEEKYMIHSLTIAYICFNYTKVQIFLKYSFSVMLSKMLVTKYLFYTNIITY